MPPRAPRPIDARGIPEQPFFKIGEVAKLAALRPSVLRYWETEFKSLRPQKTRSGQRLYRRQDLEHVLRIRQLLYEERFTIEGARTRLRELGHAEGSVAPPPVPAPVSAGVIPIPEVRQRVLEMLALLDE